MSFLYILLAIFIFGFLIFIHELGHFLVARLCGVKVLEFAIGMGPKLFSWRSKKSGTAYSLRALPLGGFVSMLGEDGMEVVQGSSAGEKTNDVPFLTSEEEERKPKLSEEDAKHAYCNQSVWKRMAISFAGPLMNLVLGLLLMLVMVLATGHGGVGTTVVGEFHVAYTGEEAYGDLKPGDYVVGVIDGNGTENEDDDEIIYTTSYQKFFDAVKADNGVAFTIVVQRLNEAGNDILNIKIKDIVLDEAFLNENFKGSLSEGCGLLLGDEIIKVNNTRVHTAHELSYEIMNQGYKPMSLTVLRNGEKVVLSDVRVSSLKDPQSGVTFGQMDFRVYPEENFNIGTVLKHTWFRSCSTVKMVFDSLSGLFSGRYGFEAVSGPVGITKTISEMARIGWINVIYLVTVISINLGIMNLLPIPGLDGGHLLIYLIELVRRKPMKRELEGVINFVGLVIMLALAVIIAVKDIISL